MGLLRSLLALPLTGPVRGASWAISQVHHAADRELNNPAHLYARLDAFERALVAGDIDEATYEAAETEILDRLEATTREVR
ncbi:MAG: gas vesicle protein GvpG [Pseudomonadota bacterium]